MIPLASPASQTLYVGIDIAKHGHVAGLISADLLRQRKRYQRCPSLTFANSRQGFEQLIATLKNHADLRNCYVLLESTGHYGAALLQYLQERGIATYIIHPRERLGKQKTDKADALNLANILYAQLHLGVQVPDADQRIRRYAQPNEDMTRLRTLMRRRYELIRDTTMRKNKLIAIVDELFPEFCEVIKDPNGPAALGLRTAYPTPAQLASASLDELEEYRRGHHPSRTNLQRLQRLAAQSIGTKNQGRIDGLVTEQTQLIAELAMLQGHLADLDGRIVALIEDSREGKVLQSLPAMSPLAAATIMAAIGNIGNFERAAKLKAYAGWCPVRTQTGTSKDSAKLDQGGNKPLKQIIWLTVARMIRADSAETEFSSAYQRLIQRGMRKSTAMGHIAGQYLTVIYSLLKADYDLVAVATNGEEPPPPTLYSREKHRSHIRGHRRPGRQ